MASKVPAAAQTLQILALLSHIDVPISAARIQAELGLPRSTTYHLLTVMRDAGFVTYLPDTRTYGLGLAAYSMASAYTTQQPLVRATAKHARELAKLVGGSAHVGRLVGGEVVYLLEERSPRGVSLITDVGVRLPAAATASGRAMLAQLPAAELKALYGVMGNGSYREWLVPITEAKHRGWGSESEEVSPGRIVTVAFFGDDDDTETFLLGSREILGTDSSVDQAVSPQSPLGAAVLGHRMGDEVSYAAPNGRTISVTITKVAS